jgi:hypothetical protein
MNYPAASCEVSLWWNSSILSKQASRNSPEEIKMVKDEAHQDEIMKAFGFLPQTREGNRFTGRQIEIVGLFTP